MQKQTLQPNLGLYEFGFYIVLNCIVYYYIYNEKVVSDIPFLSTLNI